VAPPEPPAANRGGVPENEKNEACGTTREGGGARRKKVAGDTQQTAGRSAVT
jgi:hypothetical protein